MAKTALRTRGFRAKCFISGPGGDFWDRSAIRFWPGNCAAISGHHRQICRHPSPLGQRGSAYVELVLVLPVLLFLLFAILEGGILMGVDNSLVSVVDYGIRAMAVEGGMTEEIEEKVRQQLNLRGIDPDQVRIEASWQPVQFQEEIFLRLHYDYPLRLFAIEDVLEITIPLKAETVGISEHVFR